MEEIKSELRKMQRDCDSGQNSGIKCQKKKKKTNIMMQYYLLLDLL